MAGSPDMDVYLRDELLTPEQLARRQEVRAYFHRTAYLPERRNLFDVTLFGYRLTIQSRPRYERNSSPDRLE